MVLRRVGANDDDHVGVFARRERRGYGTGADPLEQCCDRGGVAQACAVIDVIRPEAGAHQLLHQVGLLVGTLRRAEARQRLAAVAAANLRESAGGDIERLFPGCLAKVGVRIGRIDFSLGVLGGVVAADERHFQPVRVLDVVEPKAAFDAQAVVIGRTVTSLHRDDLIVLYLIGDLATDTAVGTDTGYLRK